MWTLIAVLFVAVVLMSAPQLREGWQTYRQLPYGGETTGADPLYFYPLPQYRKPYRWPLTFFQSYPTPHMSPYEPASGF